MPIFAHATNESKVTDALVRVLEKLSVLLDVAIVAAKQETSPLARMERAQNARNQR